MTYYQYYYQVVSNGGYLWGATYGGYLWGLPNNLLLLPNNSLSIIHHGGYLMTHCYWQVMGAI